MAFLIDNFSTIGSNSRKGEAPQQFSYESATDNIATIKAGNYFGAVAFQMSPNDVVVVIASDGMAIMHITSSDPVTGSVAVDSNVISNQGGSDSSASFHNVYKIEDFPTPVGKVITLENGVNYLVYIPGPFSSEVVFSLPTDYSIGGSMIYMGAMGVLEWTHTGASGVIPLFGGTAITGGGQFVLKGFKFIDADRAASGAMQISGASSGDKFGRIEIREVDFRNFPAGLKFSDVEKLLFDECDFLLDGSTTMVNPLNDFSGIVEIESENCFWQTNNINFNALELSSGDFARASFRNISFLMENAAPACIAIAANSAPSEYITIHNCTVVRQDESIGNGFPNSIRGPIKSITDGTGGTLLVTTFTPHSVTLQDQIIIYGSVDYDTLVGAVDSIPSTTTFKLTGTFTSNNYGGFFLSGGSINGYTNPNFLVTNCLGIEGPRQMGALTAVARQAVQSLDGALMFERVAFTLGEIEQPAVGLFKDFVFSSYANAELEYIGVTALSVRASFSVTIEEQATQNDILFDFRINGSAINKSESFKCRTDPTSALDFSFETMLVLEPGDKIALWIANEINDNDVTINDLSFMVSA